MKSLPSRFLAVAIAVLVLTPVQIQAADEEFASFFKRFTTDEQFRRSRIEFPLRVRIGSSCEGSEQDHRWSKLQFEEQFTAPVGRDQLAKEYLTEEITKVSNREIKIFQYHEEADSYLMTYTFKKIGGRWLLVHFEDASC